jgi:colanic acid/amylovoran biosynthesis glycosyltransferase
MTLRVGICVMSFPQISETFIVTKVLKLLDAGIDVQVFAITESPHWDSFEILRGRDDVRARVHVAPPLVPRSRVLTHGLAELAATATRHPAAFARYVAHTWRHRHESAAGLFALIYARSRLVGRDLDILHIEFDSQGVGIADLKELLGCKVLLSVRGTFQQLSTLDEQPRANDYLFRYADGYHFISRFLEANTRQLGLPADIPTWLIEPAIDLALFRPRPRSARAADSPLRIVSVGRLSWEKGHEIGLDAIARVVRAGVPIEYTIYGAGPYREAIEYAIHQHGLGGIATLGGVLRREQVPDAYANADVMLHPALAEGFCNAVIEAQAMGLPVVCSDAGGLPENVDDGVTGFVVARRDPEAFASRIIELARDPALGVRMGSAGRERALTRFDLDRQAESFVALYRELAASTRARSRPR